MSKQKSRIDLLLVEKGFFASREQAKRSIMAGQVFVNHQRIDKPGTVIDATLPIRIEGDPCPYVSRGGLKLAKALVVFDVHVQNLVAIDVGASTGGFTDCLLQNGAAKVYAVDVGYGQLDWKLRNDPRVVVMERTNIRYLSLEQLAELVQLAVIDVAFISLTKFFASLLQLLCSEGQIIALIKPQFEVGRELVGRKGVVRDLNVHCALLHKLLVRLQEFGAGLVALDYSPIRGPEGNVEYLTYFRKDRTKIDVHDLVCQTVESAKEFFKL